MYPTDVYLSEQDLEVRSLLRNFTDREIVPRRRELDEETDFRTADRLLGKLKDLGVQSYFVPEEYGGGGCQSSVVVAVLCEELARGDGGMAISQVISSCAPWFPLMVAGNKTLLDILGPRWCGEEVMSFATVFTEPDGGCDAELQDMAGRSLKTAARLEGDSYVVSGRKNWPSNAGREPGWMCVTCTTDPALGREGIANIYVPVPSIGLSFGRPEEKMGYRSCRNAAVYFDNVRVPKAYRVAGPGLDADLYYGGILNMARLTTAAMAVGIAQGAFDLVREYTGGRRGGGRPVRQHSLIAGLIADMAIGIETARAATMNVAWQLDHPATYGPPWSPAMMAKVAIARIHACEVAEKVTSRTLEMMGAAGVSREYCAEKFYRDAKMTSIWLGGMQTNRYEVAKGYYDYQCSV